MAEASELSIEPDYRKHRQAVRIDILKKITFIASCGLIAVFAYLSNSGILPLNKTPSTVHYMMHKRIDDLLQTNKNINVRYIFSSFNEELNSTNKYLIAAFLNPSTEGAGETTGEALLSDWFDKGKPLKDDYFKGLSLDMENPSIEVEFQKHEAWKEKTQLRATPTILVNGYQLPETYKIEDLRYFIDLDL